MNSSASILEAGANGAVVQLPGRAFPGLVVQGDSLSILVSTIEDLREAIAKNEPTEIDASIAMLERSLKERLEFYERVLVNHQIELPYVRRKKTG